MTNKFTPINEALAEKKFEKGLASYTQSNCQVTLTDQGYRIYRPPNINPTDNGSTMWGGLVLRPFTNDENFLVKNHTYIMMFHVKGQSSNDAELTWSNNCGWGGGGLSPNPINTYGKSIGSNFQGETEVIYKWTVSDDVRKVCTTSYSSFVAGETYISYRDFKFGFGYTATGSLGTDLYVTNLRCYDITSPSNVIDIAKSGLVVGGEFVESGISPTSLSSGGEVLAREFIEI